MVVEFTTRVGAIASDLRFADLLDIALVALALYGLLRWLRRGTSPPAARRAIAITALLVVGYILTRSFDLFLVRRLVEALVLVALVAIVVVFQHELRRLLNRLGSWRPFRREPLAPPSAAVDALVEAVAHLAERRIGALIALKGSESWDDHIHGGVALDGRLSQPLLYSLFDPDTPGHDGAVLVEAGRISRFAVHLPMPRELPPESRYGGTRHAAALGLSERCDALVVVVSEERGSISMAHERQLRELSTVGELTERIESFWRRGREAPSPAWSLGSVGSAVGSLALATLLWLVFAYSPGTVIRSAEVPVEVRNLPDTWFLEEVEPSVVVLTVSGPERAFALLDRDALAVSFDAEELEEGVNERAIEDGDVRLPERLELSDVQPPTVRVVARSLVSVTVPVEVPTLGELPGDRTLTRLQPEPDRVTVLVRPDRPHPDRLLTEPIDLRAVESSGSVERDLALPASAQLAPDEPSRVTVSLEVEQAE